jgi:hypothetical protein
MKSPTLQCQNAAARNYDNSEVQQCESNWTVQRLSIVRQMGSKPTGHQSVPVLPDTVDKRMYSPRGTLL